MKSKRQNKTMLLSSLSALVLGTFIILTIGSQTLSYEHILDMAVSLARHYKAGSGQYVSAVDFKREQVTVYEGHEDNYGRWHGLVRQDVFSIVEGVQTKEMISRYRHGKLHGITEFIAYKNNKPHVRSIWYFQDGKYKWHKSAPLLKKSTENMSNTYVYFHNHFPVDECLLDAIGYDSLYLKDFMDALELELYAETFDPEDFEDHYEAALEVLEETPYDSIINDNEALTLLNGLQIVKQHPFRLAVIDCHLNKETRSMDVLESRYAGFVSELEEADITRGDLEEFCRQFDSCLTSYGVLDLEDPFLIDSIDARIFQAIFAIYESGEEETEAVLKVAMDPDMLGLAGIKYMRGQAIAVLENALKSAEAPEVAEVILYTIFMSYLEGDMIKKSVWETWIRKNEVIVLPEVGTGDLQRQSATSATLSGYVFYNGGQELAEKGVSWGETFDPTVELNSLSSSAETDSFEVVINDLEEGKLYYVRSFATNSVGTAYGSSVSFVAGQVSGMHHPVDENGGLRLYPNPVSDLMSLSFILEKEARVEIRIFGLDGRELYHTDRGMLGSGERLLHLDLSGLAEGVYFCQLSANASTLYKQKLIIAR